LDILVISHAAPRVDVHHRNHKKESPSMSSKSLNLKGINVMVADENDNIRLIMQGLLRGFGATNVIEASDGDRALRDIPTRNVDILFCDLNLPKIDAFSLIKRLRADESNDARFIPIVILTSHTQERNIEKSRDSGANIVIAKPLSAKAVYDRLAWIAQEPRAFVQTTGYIGPDRRFKIEGLPNGIGRRAADAVLDLEDETESAISSDEIDQMFEER
jgi:two-component system, chemotaxis family, chemotaxis protein CheY